ncbi:MAG: component of SufBCD complex [Pseudomonadota bacterium]
MIGVPFDMIVRARREKDGPAMEDLNDLVHINARRLLYISETAGVLIILFGSTIGTALIIMAVAYGVEIAQAVILMGGPFAIVWFTSLYTASKIERGAEVGEPMIRRLLRQRFFMQLLGVFSIFVTAMFGMYKNLYVVPIAF